ncbi:MAG: glycosyltransferase [Gammaproteobacteria bacterium]|nr:glycosyltransferase [Gammaproteobacteria bacterium]
MIPTYNAGQTLPFALASLLSQTYQNWECIVVDDGSTDNTYELMSKVLNYDKRFKFICLANNSGRAIARQKALDNAHGKYLAMVDADDWIYPSKLEHQVHILEAHSELALVSCGMAIIDFENNLLGIRMQQNDFLVHAPLNGPGFLPVAHATSMIRLEIAKTVNYDNRFSQTEDTDFLLRLLMCKSYAVVGEPQYAYAEHSHSINAEVIIRSQIDLLMIYFKHYRKFPIKTCLQIGRVLLKLVIAFGIKMVGQEKKLTQFRQKSIPTKDQENEFNRAQQDVFIEYSKIIKLI